MFCVYSCHDIKKHELVNHVLRRMNPKNPKSLDSGCAIQSFIAQTVHGVQGHWRTSSSRRSGVFQVYCLLISKLICLYWERGPMFVMWASAFSISDAVLICSVFYCYCLFDKSPLRFVKKYTNKSSIHLKAYVSLFNVAWKQQLFS